MRRRNAASLLTSVLVITLFAGCIGGDGLGGGMPTAVVTVEELAGDTYRFDASKSTGKDVTFEWTFSDGGTLTGPVIEYTFEYGDETYKVDLLVTDPEGRQGHWSETIVVGTGKNAPPTALFSLEKRIFSVGEPVRVDARSSFDPENDPLTYRWDFNHLMSYSDYTNFRAAKADADWEDLESGKSALDLGLLRDLLGSKHAGHDDGGPGDFTPSLFTHTATTTEPSYTLDEGFPEQTVFFIRLQAVDIKGAYAAIISEEIWPVEVTNNPPPRVMTGGDSGTFDFGAPASVTDELPTDEPFSELYEFERRMEFNTDLPAEHVYVNLTFNENPLADALPYQNELRLEVTPPNNIPWSTDGAGGRLSIEWQEADDPGMGDWLVYLVARNGIDIEWELTYWVKMDINPFRELEAPYL